VSNAGRPQTEQLAARMARLHGMDRVRAAAERSGGAAYLVGGAVRDLLLGRDRADIDIAVEGDLAELAEALGGELRRHERFATAKLNAEGLEVDLASARAERYPAPGALPEVRPASLADDLARRDFTINAMAATLKGEPELIDPHGGLGDLERGLIRVLHEGSFRDDPTRALRAARYAARLGLDLEPRTAELLRRTDLSTVSEDRIDAEYRRIAAEPEAARALELASEWGLRPALAEGATGRIAAVRELLAAPDWAALVDPPAAVLAAAEGTPSAVRALADFEPERPSDAVALARERSGEELLLARAAGAEWLDRWLREWRNVGLEIDGDDLIAAGVAEGPAVGRGLDAALVAKLDGEVEGRERELELALRAARGEG
jgi:tRNA nucleotidyltransferase (CCA-adding enzyme)